jgi:hypothetical protein
MYSTVQYIHTYSNALHCSKKDNGGTHPLCPSPISSLVQSNAVQCSPIQSNPIHSHPLPSTPIHPSPFSNQPMPFPMNNAETKKKPNSQEQYQHHTNQKKKHTLELEKKNESLPKIKEEKKRGKKILYSTVSFHDMFPRLR